MSRSAYRYLSAEARLRVMHTLHRAEAMGAKPITLRGRSDHLPDRGGRCACHEQPVLLPTCCNPCSMRMNRLVGNLLDLTRLEAGAMKLTKTPCDVQDLLGVVLGHYAGRLQDRPLRDYGMGIPEVDLPHVFDKFYRVLRSDQVAGTGLGLSISKGMIEAHGGAIALGSRLGERTTVCLSLPLARPSSEQEAQS